MSWFTRLSLSTKIICVVVAALTLAVGANYAVFMTGYRKEMLKQETERAAAFTAVADEAKNHASRLILDKGVALDELVPEAQREVAKGKSYRDTRFYKTIPVVVGWTTAGEAAKKENIDFKIAAFEPRNPLNEPEHGSFREALLRDVEAQVKSGGASGLGRVNPATNTLHYMRAIKLDETCMMCHGDPAKYAAKDADGNHSDKDPLGFKMENWPVGGTHGAFEVQVPLASLDANVASFFKTGLMITVPLVLVACTIFGWWFQRSVGKPIGTVVETVKQVAAGDLTPRLNMIRGDEIGRMAGSFDQLMDSLQDIMREVSGAAHDVAAASTEIAASAEQMSASVGEVARQSAKASEAAAESGKIASEGGAVVMQTVTGMQQIDNAVTESASSVQTLGERGKQIGEVIAVINDIADQTNLLALNAAIEAARAGEHGRGFAVVADEVRKLAERTTKATEEIGGSISEIQTETTRAVEKMNRGTEQVKSGVASASAAGQSLDHIVSGAKEVASMITAISAASEEAGAGAAQSASAAQQLSTKAEQMQAMVSRFKVGTKNSVASGSAIEARMQAQRSKHKD
jgi:methyl-accepting chemotaxis protein